MLVWKYVLSPVDPQGVVKTSHRLCGDTDEDIAEISGLSVARLRRSDSSVDAPASLTTFHWASRGNPDGGRGTPDEALP